jgi:C4-dicarboxylate-specific signal transduction histidine kinase
LPPSEIELARLGDITWLTLGFVRTSESRRDLKLGDVMESVLSILHPRCQMKKIRVERCCQSGVCSTVPPHELGQITTNVSDALSVSDARVAIHIICERDTAVCQLRELQRLNRHCLHRMDTPSFKYSGSKELP